MQTFNFLKQWETKQPQFLSCSLIFLSSLPLCRDKQDAIFIMRKHIKQKWETETTNVIYNVTCHHFGWTEKSFGHPNLDATFLDYNITFYYKILRKQAILPSHRESFSPWISATHSMKLSPIGITEIPY